MNEKEKVVARLEGKKLKTFKIRTQNVFYVDIEAFDEDEAKNIFEGKIEKDYDFPVRNSTEEDGWEILEVEEEDG